MQLARLSDKLEKHLLLRCSFGGPGLYKAEDYSDSAREGVMNKVISVLAFLVVAGGIMGSSGFFSVDMLISLLLTAIVVGFFLWRLGEKQERNAFLFKAYG